jgi:branched-chain amino acid transport system permease protein
VDAFLFSLLNGAVYGLLLFMVSAGLTLVFGMMGVLNFAHASFYMLGAYFAFTLQGFIGFGPAVLLATVLSGGVGMVVERFFLRRVHQHGHAHELLLTFGLAFIIAETNQAVLRQLPRRLPHPSGARLRRVHHRPPAIPGVPRADGGRGDRDVRGALRAAHAHAHRIVVRAAIHKPRMAQALGHNVQLVFMGVFGVGAALAGLAGALAGAFYTTSPNMALEVGVMVFVVVVVGGLGSLGGAMVGSLLIGIITSLAVGVDRTLADLLGVVGAGAWAQGVGGLLTLKLSSLAATLPFALMLLILLVRPGGLMGEES